MAKIYASIQVHSKIVFCSSISNSKINGMIEKVGRTFVRKCGKNEFKIKVRFSDFGG